MSRPEADKIISWTEEQLTVTIQPWQKELFAVILMYPDVKFDVSIPRAGRSC